MKHAFEQARIKWLTTGILAVAIACVAWAIPAVGKTHAGNRSVQRVVNRSQHTGNPKSLLSVKYLPHGPKNQLTPKTGQTLRVKHSRLKPAVKAAAPHSVANTTKATSRAAALSASCTLPSAPASPGATGGANQATVTWTAASGTPTAYVVTAYSGSTPENSEALPPTATSAVLHGLASGSYTFQIFAQNACGNGPAATTSAATVTGASTTYASTVMGLAPSAFFRLGEPATSVLLADSSGHGLLANFDTANSSSVLLGSPGAISDGDTAVNDQSGQWVGNVPAPANLPVANQPRTIQAWVKPNDGYCRWVLGFGSSNTTNTSYNLGECANQIGVSAAYDDLWFPTPEPLTDGAWHMLTITYDGSKVTAYLDNRSLGTKTFSNPLSTQAGGLALGSWSNQCCNSWTYGGLDEEAVYPSALTAAQVSSEFAASGLGVSSAPTGASASSPSNNTANVNWTAPANPPSPATGYLITAKKGSAAQESIAAPATATSATLTGLPSGSYTFTVVAENGYGASSAATTSSVTVAGAAKTYESTVVADKPAVFYRLDEPSGTPLAADSSGKNILAHYATSCITQGVAGPLPSDPATATNDTSACNDIADEASNANLPSGTATRTLQAWIKPNDGNLRWFMGYGGTSYTDDEFELGNSSNAVVVRLQNDDHSFYSFRNIADGNWHLVTVTAAYSATTNLTTLTAYLDGQKLGAQTTGPLGTPANVGMQIGRGPTDCCYYGGVADAAVYPSALSATSIAALMTASGNTVPAQPTSVAAAGGANKATVTWAAPGSGSPAVSYYIVTEYNSSGKAQQSLAAPGSATSATIDSLPGGSYTFKVTPYNTYGAGAVSAATSSTTVTGSATTYASTVIASKPALYYRLNENGVRVAGDSSGNLVQGGYASSGVTQGVSGALADGSDLAASQTGSFLMEAGGSTLIPSGDSNRTLEAWVKPSDGGCRDVASFGTTNTDQGFELAECPSEVIVGGYNDNHTFYTSHNIDDGSWHFLAATYNDTGGVNTITAYLDGQSLGTQQFASSLTTPAQSTLWVGSGPNNCSCDSYSPFYGSIDEVAVYPTALAASAISSQFVAAGHAVPSAPTGVSAVAGANQATVSWTDSTSSDAVTGYVVTAYKGSTATVSQAVPGTASSATVTGLQGATPYTFKVVAYDGYGASPAGTSSSATPTGSTTTYSSILQGDSPAAYYRLAEPSGTQIMADSSGQGAHGLYIPSATTYGQAGALPSDSATSVSDNGNDAIGYNQNEAQTANLPAANQARTLVAWVKLGDNNCRYALGYGVESGDEGYGLVVCGNSVGVAGWGDDHYFGTVEPLNDGNWHMVAVTFDGTHVTAYVDGNNEGTSRFNNQLNTAYGTNLYVGAGPQDAGNRWYGGLAQAAVLPSALSASQISALFNASGYSTPTAPSGVTATAGANAATVNWTAASSTSGAVTGYLVTAYAGGTTAANAVATAGNQTSVTLHGLKGSQAYTFKVVAYNPYGSGPAGTSSSVTPSGSATTYASTVQSDGASAYYRLGESSGNLAADSSGNGGVAQYNTGSVTLGQAGALTHDASETSIFDSSSWAATAPMSSTNPLPTGSAARSMSIWLKPNNNGCNYVMGYGTTNYEQSSSFYVCPSSVDFYGWSDDVTINTGVNIDDGNWHQLVVTYDGANTVTLYVDGTSEGTGTISQPLNTPAGSQLYIGAGANDYGSTYGNLQDAAVFPTALSASQVSALYGAR